MKPDAWNDLYREVILDHYRRPRGENPLSHADREAEGKNALCGDDVTLQLQLDGECVAGVSCRVRGCSICTASGSMLAEAVRGKTLQETERLADDVKKLLRGEGDPEGRADDLAALSGVRNFPVRVKCALLPWMTLDEALRSLQSGAGGGAKDEATSTEDPTPKEPKP